MNCICDHDKDTHTDNDGVVGSCGRVTCLCQQYQEPSHAVSTLKFWQDNNLSPVLATEYVDECSEDEQPAAHLDFEDGSSIKYGVYGGHADTLLAIHPDGETVEAHW